MRAFYLIPTLIFVLAPVTNAKSLSINSARICSKEKENPVFIKLIGYPDRFFRVEECGLSGVDEIDCRDIKGYGPNGVLKPGTPPNAFSGDLLGEHDRERNKKIFMATLTGDVGFLAREAKRASAIHYVQSILWSHPGSQDCQIYEGDFVTLVDDLRQELGRQKAYPNPNAKNDFLLQIYQVETERHSVSPDGAKFSGGIWFTRTKGGPLKPDPFFIRDALLPQPPEAPAISAEQGSPQ